MSNPRRKNGTRRNALRRRVASLGLPCALCGQPINYDLPHGHPMSYELDEIVPVSRYYEGGYSTPTECALDPDNVQPTHRACNRRKSNRMPGDRKQTKRMSLPLSRDWSKP